MIDFIIIDLRFCQFLAGNFWLALFNDFFVVILRFFLAGNLNERFTIDFVLVLNLGLIVFISFRTLTLLQILTFRIIAIRVGPQLLRLKELKCRFLPMISLQQLSA